MGINEISGIGPKTEKLFNKLEIYNINDLVTYFPYKYNVYIFSDLTCENSSLIINAVVESSPNIFYIRKNFNRLSFRARNKNIVFNVVIFNRAFLKSHLNIGKNITLVGKYDYKKNLFTASDIKFDIKEGQVEAFYHLTDGLNNNTIKKTIQNALCLYNQEDLIPLKYKKKYHFIDKIDSLNYIHFPNNYDEVKIAKTRLIYEELFDFSFKMQVLKMNNSNVLGTGKSFNDENIQTFIASLPFFLTDDQVACVKEILNDLKLPKRMNRLVLGDVGSGKTIVAVIALYATFLSGFQSAMMVPTEILAIQHYKSIKGLLECFNLKVDIITGSMSKKEKSIIYNKLLNGEINLIIGTHSILNDDIKFNKLGLVITDEQHRFGVNQRSILQEKGNNPDILYLSATPIPRTYAMTIYGDLDISYIKSKPSERKGIITYLKTEKEIKEVLMAILNEVKMGHQIYVVSPLVEQNDTNDLSSVKLLKEKLDLAFQGKIRSEIIHGKMKQTQKDAVMQEFKNNDIKILISTTVIEIGIDVPNATLIVIFNAERFGLATLHQLRGRVGRNSIQSYCYLISNFEKERLEVMCESNDGFYISKRDFEIRGYGDLFGVRQHGDMTFKIANLKNDYDVLVKTMNDSREYLDNKEYLDNEYYSKLVSDLNIID